MIKLSCKRFPLIIILLLLASLILSSCNKPNETSQTQSENELTSSSEESKTEDESSAILSNEELIKKYSIFEEDYKWNNEVWHGEDVLLFTSVMGRYFYDNYESTTPFGSYCKNTGMYVCSTVGYFQVSLADSRCYWVDVSSAEIKPATTISLTAKDESGDSFELDTFRVRTILFDESGCYAFVDYASGYFEMWAGDQKYTEEQGNQNNTKDAGFYMYEVDKEGNFTYKSRFLVNCKETFNTTYIAPIAQQYDITHYKMQDDFFSASAVSFYDNKLNFVLSYYVTDEKQIGSNYTFSFNISFPVTLQGAVFGNADVILRKISIGNLTEFSLSPICFITDKITIFEKSGDEFKEVRTITDKETLDEILSICAKVEEYSKPTYTNGEDNKYWIDFDNNIILGIRNAEDYGNIYSIFDLYGNEVYQLQGSEDYPNYILPSGLYDEIIKVIG